MSHEQWISKHNCYYCQNERRIAAEIDPYSFSYMCYSTGYCNNEFLWFFKK